MMNKEKFVRNLWKKKWKKENKLKKGDYKDRENMMKNKWVY